MVETARTVAAELRSRDTLRRDELAGELYGSRWRIDVSPILDTDISLSPQSQWIPQVVTIRVRSPSGALVSLQTVRLQRKRE